MNGRELLRAATAARENAYAPYSGFAVGAALLGKSGRLYTGCNVENAAFTPTCCAERVALFHAVAEGERAFSAIAVVGGPAGAPPRRRCAPCGVCRQALSEFSPDGALVVYLGQEEAPEAHTLAELLPCSFGQADL